ncbi:hypothetical protein DdX_12634 [Ditylenchus destructor]|uniref:Uncharacterized protein n=1 Tax=Ditylenchus destructor TaxID=166010 RepID=A0AAD4R399_9BILA|nr:hypothetical protein DdX_12634 [Ditylenchus destructor]
MRVSLAEYYRGTKKELERKLSEKRREQFNRRHAFYRAENEIPAQSTAYDGNEHIDDSRNESTCADVQQDESMNSSTLDDSRTTSDDSPSQKLIKIGERISRLNDLTKKRRQIKRDDDDAANVLPPDSLLRRSSGLTPLIRRQKRRSALKRPSYLSQNRK